MMDCNLCFDTFDDLIHCGRCTFQLCPECFDHDLKCCPQCNTPAKKTINELRRHTLIMEDLERSKILMDESHCNNMLQFWIKCRMESHIHRSIDGYYYVDYEGLKQTQEHMYDKNYDNTSEKI